MSNLFLLTAVRVQTTVTDVLERLAERIADDERGQDTIEYIGVLLVVAALIAVVVGVVNKSLGTTITNGAKSLISNVLKVG
jgi:Flp pilus assembly pilin Flp